MDPGQPHHIGHGPAGSAVQAAAALALLTLLSASQPATAQPYTRTITSGETVVLPRNTPFGVRVNESLLIEQGGELQGRGASIGVYGLLQNNGRLRAFDDPENANAVAVAGWPVQGRLVPGRLISSATGLLEVTALSVGNGGIVQSSGGFVTGGFRINASDPLTTVCAYLVPCPGTGFSIDTGGLIWVTAGAPMLNYGNAQIAGTLTNAGSFVSRNGANTTGTAYDQTLTVGKDPIYGTGSGQIFNAGSFELQRGNTLRNFSSVSNSGSLSLDGGRFEQSDKGELVNTGSVVVGSGGQLTANSTLGYDNFGKPIAAVVSTGSIIVRNNGSLHNGWMTRVQATGSAAPTLTVEFGGTLTQASSGLLSIAGGQMVVAGQVTGGEITLDNLGSNVGSVRIRSGGSVNVDSYRQTDGELRVDGSLTGQVYLDGGNLRGTGRINGDTFISGAGGGPPQQRPNCGNAFFACFRPGNSPGHMDIFGALTMGENSILELEVERAASGELQWDSIYAASASFGYGSTLRLLVAPNAAGADWLNLDLIRCETGCSFEGLRYEVVGADDGYFAANGAGGLSFWLAPATAPVPEPGSAALLAAGLGLLGWRRLRRRNLAAAQAGR